MKFAISLGTYSLTGFARLNLAYLRKVFGDATPIIIYDGKSENSPEIQQIALEYGCAYLPERANRGHFSGDIQSAVTAIAFAQQYDCDIGIKLNQRTILLSPDIPKLLAEAFSDPQVTLVTPAPYPLESIVDSESRFHSRFRQAVDVLCFRASEWDAQGVADRYRLQWTTGTSKYDCYSEEFWANEVKRIGPAHRTVDWLTAHELGKPFKYLRKIQNSESDYSKAAIEIGLPVASYRTQEWSKLKPGEYRPVPRA